jgi:hypothetical protein
VKTACKIFCVNAACGGIHHFCDKALVSSCINMGKKLIFGVFIFLKKTMHLFLIFFQENKNIIKINKTSGDRLSRRKLKTDLEKSVTASPKSVQSEGNIGSPKTLSKNKSPETSKVSKAAATLSPVKVKTPLHNTKQGDKKVVRKPEVVKVQEKKMGNSPFKEKKVIQVETIPISVAAKTASITVQNGDKKVASSPVKNSLSAFRTALQPVSAASAENSANSRFATPTCNGTNATPASVDGSEKNDSTIRRSLDSAMDLSSEQAATAVSKPEVKLPKLKMDTMSKVCVVCRT